MKVNISTDIDTLALSNGSVKEFDRLYASYYPKVKSFLVGMLGNDDDAEDLAQDVFVNLWNGRKSLSDVHNLNAYVYQTVKHVLFSFINRKKAIFQTDIETAYDLPSSENTECLTYINELHTIIDHVVNEMPPQRKLVFSMSRIEGMSIEEISEKLGISKRTVETHISLALSTLRKVVSSLSVLLFC